MNEPPSAPDPVCRVRIDPFQLDDIDGERGHAHGLTDYSKPILDTRETLDGDIDVRDLREVIRVHERSPLPDAARIVCRRDVSDDHVRVPLGGYEAGRHFHVSFLRLFPEEIPDFHKIDRLFSTHVSSV